MFCVFPCDLIGLVFVAAIAGVFDIRNCMAGLTCDLPPLAMVEREGMDLQKSRRPGRVAMALLAFQAEETQVNGWLSMALDTPGDDALVDASCMTLQAGDLDMRAFQWKNCLVVEISHPVPSVMTFQAGLTVLRCVLLHETGILVTMTGRA
ncbi:MAG: hypothetical protein A2W35_07565 [Chloroflexi bacterium RBG_16_57_11]|nr:MAG: hypothetical protein A2W35_07565 [Chloroflexi bacterium RBG_16_57_11]